MLPSLYMYGDLSPTGQMPTTSQNASHNVFATAARSGNLCTVQSLIDVCTELASRIWSRYRQTLLRSHASDVHHGRPVPMIAPTKLPNDRQIIALYDRLGLLPDVDFTLDHQHLPNPHTRASVRYTPLSYIRHLPLWSLFER
jgi:hypothetical protein